MYNTYVIRYIETAFGLCALQFEICILGIVFAVVVIVVLAVVAFLSQPIERMQPKLDKQPR